MSDRQEDSGWWVASDGKWYPPETHPSARLETELEPASQYAGFWIRFVAWLVDAVIVSIGLTILGSITGIGSNVPVNGFDGSGFFLNVVGNWLYVAFMDSSANQGTLGKMLLNIKVTDLQGTRISFGRATGRYFAKFISALLLMVGFMMAGWTKKKQALHDMIVGTLVVRASRS